MAAEITGGLRQTEQENRLRSERWADIPDFVGYQVSDLGRVRSRLLNYKLKPGAASPPWRLRSLAATRAGYRMVWLRIAPGVAKGLLVHRLVAQAFIPNPSALPEVHHMNSDRGDNRAENLEWQSVVSNRSKRRAAVFERCDCCPDCRAPRGAWLTANRKDEESPDPARAEV